MRFFCYNCQDRTSAYGLGQPTCAICHSAFIEELASEDSELRGPSVAELYSDPDVNELAQMWDTALSNVFGPEEEPRERGHGALSDDGRAEREDEDDSENWVDEEEGSDPGVHYHHRRTYFIYSFEDPPSLFTDEEGEDEYDDEYDTEEESDEFYDSYDDYDTEDGLNEEDLESVDMYSGEDFDRLYNQEDEEDEDDDYWQTEEENDEDADEDDQDHEIYVEPAEYYTEESDYADAEETNHDVYLSPNEDDEHEEYYGYSSSWHTHEHGLHDYTHRVVHFITSVRGFREIWDAIYDDDNALHPSFHGATDEEINKLPRRKLPVTHPAVDIDCAICHEEFGTDMEIINLPCRHEYHYECIRQWLTINASCPICRSPIACSN